MNLKKVFLFSLILCLLSGGLYFFRSLNHSEKDPKSEASLTPQHKNDSLIPNKGDLQQSAQIDPQKKVVAEATQEEVDKEFERIERMESAWEEKIKETFLSKMNLSEEEFKEYLVMKEGYEDDRYLSYDKFHKDNMAAGKEYPITLENEENDKIVEEYQNLFKARFGEEAFAHYVKALDEFNSEWRVKEGQDKGILTIDF